MSDVWELFREYWELALLLATWTGLGVLWVRRRLDWRGRRFTEQVNFSLNLIERLADGRRVLRLRTLLEEGAGRVWLNEYGVGVVRAAAARTTAERPFLRVSPEETALVNHAVLNVLSERFSEAYLARALGAQVRTGRFLFAVSWEPYEDVRTRKLRVMVVRPGDLESLFGPDGRTDDVEVEQESHGRRLQTLGALYRLWRSDDPLERSVVGEVELGVLVGGALRDDA